MPAEQLPIKLPVVSVIVPTYKGTEFLREAIDSILAQTYPAVEPVIINDGSPDNTAEVLAEYGDRIVAITQQNAGTASARNRGLKEITGDYVAFLDHDDLWHPDKLEKQMALFNQFPEAGMVYCGRQFFDHYTRKITSEHPAEAELNVHQLLSMQAIALQAVVIKKSIIDELGGFDTGISGADDWELTIRIAAKYRVLGVPECLVDIRGHEGQQSINSDYMYQRIAIVLDRYRNLHTHFPTWGDGRGDRGLGASSGLGHAAMLVHAGGPLCCVGGELLPLPEVRDASAWRGHQVLHLRLCNDL